MTGCSVKNTQRPRERVQQRKKRQKVTFLDFDKKV